MSDLISRQDAIDEITEYGSGDTIYMSVAELKRRIEHLPPVQPEQPEIIRCKDCWYWDKRDGRMYCEEMYFDQDDPDFYCGYAERRTDE